MRFTLSIEDSYEGFCLVRKEEGVKFVDEICVSTSLMYLVDMYRAINLNIDRNTFRQVQDDLVDNNKKVRYSCTYETVNENIFK